ncbi:MAG: carboxylating nicotinate-nucleotide diphosphorylase [Oscillospiraceae bacterium]
MKLMQFQIDDIIKNALAEDINYVDVTTDYLVDDNSVSTAKYVSKDDGVLCGIDVALRVFELLDENMSYKVFIHDGEKVKKGDIIAEITGSTRALLKGERTALNLVQHMSGVATATNKCVELVKGTKASIADTRKTLPGLRILQKYAVTVGGGKNHRYNLSDCAMLKDTHLDAYGSMTNAVNVLRKKMGHTIKIEVEVSNLEQLNEALELGVEIIMLDNMSNEDMAKAVKITDGRAKLEASGNVTAETIRGIAETGVDIISLGALTHSVKAFDISMKIVPNKKA